MLLGTLTPLATVFVKYWAVKKYIYIYTNHVNFYNMFSRSRISEVEGINIKKHFKIWHISNSYASLASILKINFISMQKLKLGEFSESVLHHFIFFLLKFKMC